MMFDVEEKLCPKCGAYWKCDCVIDEPAIERQLPPSDVPGPQEQIEAPKILQAAGCQHDWTEVVGVELDEDSSFTEAQVMVCRLCGLYAVEKSA